MTAHDPARRPLRSKDRVDSFRHAFRGWSYTLRTQRNTWIHGVITLGALAVGLWLGLTRFEWALIVLVAGLVWVAEFANTAVETLVDLVSPEFHPLAKTSKDVAAAGVLVSAFTAILIGLLILGPPLLYRVLDLFAPLLRADY